MAQQFPCKIVEQLGMRGRLALNTEIVGGGDDAPAKVPGPDSIDHDARRERIVRPSQPESQSLPAAEGTAQISGLTRLLGQNRGKGRLHFFFGPAQVAPAQPVHFGHQFRLFMSQNRGRWNLHETVPDVVRRGGRLFGKVQDCSR